MGNEYAALRSVKYEYTGEVPDMAPTLPLETNYIPGAKINVAENINLLGYTFSGWTTTDVTIANGTFTMPDSDVILTGSFTKVEETYSVKYKIDGIVPNNYVVPSTKNYYANTLVNVDSLETNTVFCGYRFLGWTTTDVTVSDDKNFVMPEKNIEFTGTFEEVTYKLTYQFYDSVLPPGASTYLPEQKKHINRVKQLH